MMDRQIAKYRSTLAEPLTSLRELRALVACAIPRLRWRHHGLGVLQAYLVEDQEPEIRVHIWHPELTMFGPEEAGRIHNHRFTLRSSVIHGMVGHDEVHIREDAEGPWTQYEVIHARNQRPDDMPAPCAGSYAAEIVEGTVSEGYVYVFPKREFHRSRVTDLAVTIVTKIDQETTPARLLVPKDYRPGHGIGHHTSVDVQRYTTMAVEALSRSADALEVPCVGDRR